MSCPNQNKSDLGSLSVAAPEVIAAIFEKITSVDDAICLAITHRLLSFEGFRKVDQLRRDEHNWGNWAGDRIITAGDYCTFSKVSSLPG